jgi:hypothetical protein
MVLDMLLRFLRFQANKVQYIQQLLEGHYVAPQDFACLMLCRVWTGTMIGSGALSSLMEQHGQV